MLNVPPTHPLNRALAARRAITEHAAGVLQEMGVDMTTEEIAEFGAEEAFARAGVPIDELGIARNVLLATGHSTVAMGQPEPGWPKPVPIRPDNWDCTRDPCRYSIALGDTWAGLAHTYLGTPTRWKELWDFQPDTFRYSRTPAELWPGEWVLMPPAAEATYRHHTGKPKKPGTPPPAPLPPSVPTPPRRPGDQPLPPGGVEPEKKTTWDEMKPHLPLIVGGVAVAALGAYAAFA